MYMYKIKVFGQIVYQSNDILDWYDMVILMENSNWTAHLEFI